MKRKLKLFLLSLLSTCFCFSTAMLAACGDTTDDGGDDPYTDGTENDGNEDGDLSGLTYTVTFDSNGGSAVASQNVPIETAKVTKPANPTRTGYEFAYWTLNNRVFEFSSSISGNITLKAYWRTRKDLTYTIRYYDASTGLQITSETMNNGETDKQTNIQHPEKFTYQGKYYVADVSNPNNVTSAIMKLDGTTEFKLYYTPDGSATELDASNAVGFTVAGSKYTAPAETTSHVYTRGSGKAFIASVDMTITKNVSDCGLGFSVKDSDGNNLNFIFTGWAKSTICAQYGYDNLPNSRWEGTSTFFNYNGHTLNVKTNVGIAYDGSSFTIYENGLFRTRFTLADINANLGLANGRFTTDESLSVGLYGFNFTNTGGSFENFAVNFYSKEEIASKFTADVEVYNQSQRIMTIENASYATGSKTFSAPLATQLPGSTDEYVLDQTQSQLQKTLSTAKQTFKVVYKPLDTGTYMFNKGGANYEYLVSGSNVYVEANATVGQDGQRFNGFVISQGSQTSVEKKVSFIFNHSSVMVQHAYGWDEDGFRYAGRNGGNDTALNGDKAYMDAIEAAQGTGNRTGVVANGDILKSASATNIRIELTGGLVKVYAGGTLYVTVDLATLNTGLSLGFDMSASFDVGLYGFDCQTGGQDVTFTNVTHGTL